MGRKWLLGTFISGHTVYYPLQVTLFPTQKQQAMHYW